MTDNKQLTTDETQSLRSSHLLSENEYAYRAGDLIVAENPVTGEKRIVGKASLLSENNKRVLKG